MKHESNEEKSHILPRGTAVSGRLTTANTRTDIPICPMKFSFFCHIIVFFHPPRFETPQQSKQNPSLDPLGSEGEPARLFPDVLGT